MIVAAAVAVIAWGALAFGAVYPWAFKPLLVAAAAVGSCSLFLNRGRRLGPPNRAAMMALVCVLGAGLLQIVPLPARVLSTVSPSTDTFLRNHDLAYGLAAEAGDAPQPDGATSGSRWHPFSLAPRASVVSLAMLAAFTLFLAGLLRALTPSRARRLAAVVVAFGVLLALVGIVQKAVLGDHAWAGMKIYGFWAPLNRLSTPFGPFVNKNHFAGWMLMAIPLALGLAIGTAEQGLRNVRRSWRSIVLWFSSPEGGRLQLVILAVLIMGASLLMTKSRSGVGCLLAALIMVSVAAGRRFGSIKAAGTALVSLVVLFVVVFALAGGEFAARITNRMDAMELRKDIWADSAAVIRAFPVTGTGLNTFGTAMLAYQTSEYDQHFQEAHNDYLQVLVEGGVLVALPALAALVLIVRGIRRRFAEDHDDPVTWWVRAGAAIGLAAIGLQAIVEFSLQMPGNAALFVVLLAIALHETPPRRSRSAPREGTRE